MAKDGHGTVRRKDVHPEQQSGHGSVDRDKFPRPVLTADDLERGALLSASIIVGTGML